MAAIFDFRCAAHGNFEGTIGKCPYGCGAGMVEKIFLKAPGTLSDKTKNTTVLQKQLADRYGLTDMQAIAGRPAVPDNYRWNSPEALAKPHPYSVAVDPNMNILQQAQSQGGVPNEENVMDGMKKSGHAKFNYNVLHDDKVSVTQKDIENADTR